MFALKKILPDKLYKSFHNGKFTMNIPNDVIQFIAVKDSSIDFYLISPNQSISFISSTDLGISIISSALLKKRESEKDLIILSIEGFNDQIELIVLEFNELLENFQTISKYTFGENNNKKRTPAEYIGAKIYCKNMKIVAMGYINFMSILAYDEKNSLIIYEKEIFAQGFFGEVLFDENGKYLYTITNHHEENKLINHNLIRIDMQKFEIDEIKLSFVESAKELLIKHSLIDFDIFLFASEANIHLKSIAFEKKIKKKEKVPKSKTEKEKNYKNIIINNGSVTNFHIFDEFVLIGFDIGKIMVYNRFSTQKHMSGVHSYHFPDVNNALYYEMWFYKYNLYCLVCLANEIRIYNLDYEKKESGELIILENKQKNEIMVQKHILNSVIDSVFICQGDNSKIFCLMDNQSNQNNFFKKIEFGAKPMQLLKFLLFPTETNFKEFGKFKIFENKQCLLMLFSLNSRVKCFKLQLEKKNLLKEVAITELNKISDFLDIFQINEEILCVIGTNYIKFLRNQLDFENISTIFDEKLKSNVKLFQKFIYLEKKLFLCFILEDNRLVLCEFIIEKDKITSQSVVEKIIEQSPYENIFLYKTKSQDLSVLLTFFHSECSKIYSYSSSEKKISDLATNFFPEFEIFSFVPIEIADQLFLFVSTYSSEMLVLIEGTNEEYEILGKWKFYSKEPLKLKKRNENSLYLYSFYETYLIDLVFNLNKSIITCIKVILEKDEPNPTYLERSKNNNFDIFVTRDQFSFNQFICKQNGQIEMEACEDLVVFQTDILEKKKKIISGSPLKNKPQNNNPKTIKYKRLVYSENHEILLLLSTSLNCVIYDPFINQKLMNLNLKYFLFKSNEPEYSLDLFKLIKFPNNYELLCIASSFAVISENEEDNEEIINRLNFCELIKTPHFSLQDFPYEVRFASEQFIKRHDEPILDIIFLFKLEVFAIAVGGKIEVYSFELLNTESLDFKFALVLKQKVASKIICLDSIDGENLILAGDYTKSIYIYRLEKTLSPNEKFLYKLILLRSEREQRLLSIGKFIDEESFIGIDKYGECFISKINNESYYDCNNNIFNYAMVSLRSSSRNIHFSHSKFNSNREINLKNLKKDKLVKEENKYILIPTLLGGLQQAKFIDLIFLFDDPEINKIVQSFAAYLKKQKSLKFSNQLNNCLKFSSFFKLSQNFLDMEEILQFIEENKITQNKLFDYFLKEQPMNEINITLDKLLIALTEIYNKV